MPPGPCLRRRILHRDVHADAGESPGDHRSGRAHVQGRTRWDLYAALPPGSGPVHGLPVRLAPGPETDALRRFGLREDPGSQRPGLLQPIRPLRKEIDSAMKINMVLMSCAAVVAFVGIASAAPARPTNAGPEADFRVIQ